MVPKKYQKKLEDAGCITVIESELCFDDSESARVRPSQKVSSSTDNIVTAKSKPQNHEKQSITTEETTTNEVPIKSFDTFNMRFKFLIRFMLQQTHHVWNRVIKNSMVIASLVIFSLMFGLFWVVAPANMKDKVVGLLTFASAERQCFNYNKEYYFKDPDSAYIENGFIRTKNEEMEIKGRNSLAIFEKFDSVVMVNVQAKNSMGGYGSELIMCPLVDNRFDRAVVLSYDILQRANDLYKKDKYAEALPLFQSLAEQGNAEAQYKLGLMSWDDTQKIYWYKKAAEQGYADAQINLGSMYYWGKGVAKDDTLSAYWYNKFEANVEKKEYMSQRADDLYDQGQYAEALPLYLHLAEQSNAEAQYRLGFMFLIGNGVAKDKIKSAYWYNKFYESIGMEKHILQRANALYEQNQYAEALPLYLHLAEQGNVDVDTKVKLGFIYRIGDNDAQSVYWYKKAAEQGNAEAQYELGQMYYFGKGVATDCVQVDYWYKKAAAQGHKMAQIDLITLNLFCKP